MPIPTVLITQHERYTPELRDRIAEALRAPLSATAYHVLTPPLLRELAGAVSESAPVLSLYLQLTPERRIGGAWRTYLSGLSDGLLRATEDRQTLHALQQEFTRIRQAMDDELPALGRGVVFFACSPLSLWRQIAMPLPLPDGAHRGPRPYVRPLVRTRDEHDRFIIALLSKGLSRYFVSQIGQVQEVLDISRASEATEIEPRILAKTAEQVMTRYEGRYLLLAETEKLRAAVTHDLGKEFQHRLGAEFVADIHAHPSEIAQAAERAQRAIEAREENATVQRLLDAGPQRSAQGVPAMLGALREHRVATLVVDDIFAAPGARCRACANLLQAPQDSCPSCGSNSIDVVEDMVELAIEQTLDEDGAFEMVRSTAAREMLSPMGPIAALLRW
jgi:peptide subunit release factor 1 (eRF1)